MKPNSKKTIDGKKMLLSKNALTYARMRSIFAGSKRKIIKNLVPKMILDITINSNHLLSLSLSPKKQIKSDKIEP